MHGYLKEHIGAFGPHEIRTLVAALDTAWESIQASGVTFETSSHAESARAILAKHIIDSVGEVVTPSALRGQLSLDQGQRPSDRPSERLGHL
jgi:hypothetical protein